MLIEIDGWKVGLTFSACHIIFEQGKCERLHGHSYAVHSRVRGELGKRRMVLNFIKLKNAIRNVIEELDHRILLPRTENVKVEEDAVELKFKQKQYRFPKGDVLLLDIKSDTAEDLATYILEKVVDQLKPPRNIEEIEIGLDEGPGQDVWVAKKL